MKYFSSACFACCCNFTFSAYSVRSRFNSLLSLVSRRTKSSFSACSISRTDSRYSTDSSPYCFLASDTSCFLNSINRVINCSRIWKIASAPWASVIFSSSICRWMTSIRWLSGWFFSSTSIFLSATISACFRFSSDIANSVASRRIACSLSFDLRRASSFCG